jgi:hypothetical protein
MKVFYIDSFFNIIEYKTQIRPVLDRFDSNHHCSNLNSRYQKWRVQNRTPYLRHGLVVLLDNLDKTWRVWRYQRFNHNPHIEEEHNGQRKKYKRTNNDPQNIHTKSKIEQNEPQGELRCSGRASSSRSTSGTRSKNIARS